MANLQLPSWAPYALAGVVGVLLIGSALSPDDDAPRGRKRTKAVRKAEVKASRAMTVEEKAKRAKAKAYAAATVAAAKADASGTVTARRTADAAERKVERIDEIQAKLDSGNYTPSELHDWMKSGTLRFRNPEEGAESSTSERGARDLAVEMSEQFHGSKLEVMQLSPQERQISEYVVALGPMPEVDYEPDRFSERHGWVWEHRAGDRGDFEPKATGRPVLAVDPITRRPVLVMHRSSMTFDPARGLVG